MSWRNRLFAAVLCVFAAQGAQAQTPAWPARPIRLIVPFTAGGGNDAVARTIGDRLADRLGQRVVVDNRGGAGGLVGAELAAHAPADGYTLFLGGVGSHAINPVLHAQLPYDPVKDFAPVSLIAAAPLVVVVHPSLPVDSISALLAWTRSRPRQLEYASNGIGSSSQLAAELFASTAGVQLVHVPYKGLAPALTDLLGGQVRLMFSSMVAIIPHVKAGRLRALAVTGARRSPLLPEVPTVAESGLPGYQAGSWYGILAPAGTPQPIVQRLNREISVVLERPDVRASLAADGAEAVGGTPQQFAEHIEAELARMRKLVKTAGIRLE
jgi:tripartite-type tricarboxylate transporter receptor subunit TctC